MKTALPYIFLVAALTAIPGNTSAQEAIIKDDHNFYVNAIGILAGTENGFSFRHFYRPSWALEADATTGSRSLIITGLAEKNIALSKQFFVFFGGGIHVSNGYKIVNYNLRYGENSFREKRKRAGAGVDGILGIEYRFTDIPFALSAQVKPLMDVVNPDDNRVEGTFGLRYTFR